MAIDPLPTTNKVFSLILQYEREFVTTDKENAIQPTLSSFARGNANFHQGGNNSNQGNFQNSYQGGQHNGNFHNNFQGNCQGNLQNNGFGYKRQQNGNKKGLCSFCNGNHLVVNYWKKNGYPAYFKSKFSKANISMGCEEVLDQDVIEQNYQVSDYIEHNNDIQVIS